MKLKILFLATLAALSLASCTDVYEDKNMPFSEFYKPVEVNYNYSYTDLGAYSEGFNFHTYNNQNETITKVEEGVSIQADDELIITFQAGADSPLLDYDSDTYLHIWIQADGVSVGSAWLDNDTKYTFRKSTVEGQENVWQIRLTPSVRAFLNSGSVAVEKVGVIIRSGDGSKKGLANDFFIDVEDSSFANFEPAPMVKQAMEGDWDYGINRLSDSEVAFVLYDKDLDGKSKDYAHIIGDFNNWELTNDANSQMYRDDEAGVWWYKLTGLEPNKEYRFQYYIGTHADGSMRIADPYSEKILDQSNDKWIHPMSYPESKMQYPEEGAAGIVTVFTTTPDNYNWEGLEKPTVTLSKNNLIIYEMLLREFTDAGDIKGAMAKLDYIESLGVNAIELMPVQEFDGNDSWGYNPCFFFAMDKAYGTREDYKDFIKECHRRGIAVLFDVVYNHATGANPFARLWWDAAENKTASNNPFFNVDAPHPYSVFHDFNHESPLVKEFVKRNLKFLLDEYKIDGFRFDLTKGFTQNESDESNASNYDQSRIDILKGYNAAIKETKEDAFVILEHFCDVYEETELAKDGMMLWCNANHAFKQSAAGYPEGSSFHAIHRYDNKSDGFADLQGRPNWGWVGFMESHDEERTAYVQIAWGSSFKDNLATRMDQLGVNTAFAMLVPGPKMIWQFGELGYDFSINSNESGEIGDYRISRKPIRWDYYSDADRKGLYDDYAKILSIREDYAEFFDGDGDKVDWWDVAPLQEAGNWWWTTSKGNRYMRIVDGSRVILVIGNFSNSPLQSTYGGSDWNDIFTGEAIGDLKQFTVPANSYKIVKNF